MKYTYVCKKCGEKVTLPHANDIGPFVSHPTISGWCKCTKEGFLLLIKEMREFMKKLHTEETLK
jgi:hypothetical protein